MCEDNVGDGGRVVDQDVGIQGSVNSGQLPSSSQSGVNFEKPIADLFEVEEDVDGDAMVGVESQKPLSGSSEIEEEDTPMVDVESKGPFSEIVQDEDVYRMIDVELKEASEVVASDESMVGVRPNMSADGNEIHPESGVDLDGVQPNMLADGNENHPESGVDLDGILDVESNSGQRDPTNTDESNQMSVDLESPLQHAPPPETRRSSRHAVAKNKPSEKFTVSKSHRSKKRRTLKKNEILLQVSFSINLILKTYLILFRTTLKMKGQSSLMLDQPR